MTYTVRPISDRTAFAGKHRNSPFESSWSSTETLLLRELAALRARNAVLEVDVAEGGIRVDGRMKANARVASPAVRLAFDSSHGPLTYATDRFWGWRDNVRAIALGLEALRKVDRYGITERGEQYTGFKALPGGTPMPARSTMSSSDAAELLRTYGVPGDSLESLLRRAQRKTHPDAGGRREDFERVQEAARVLGLAKQWSAL